MLIRLNRLSLRAASLCLIAGISLAAFAPGQSVCSGCKSNTGTHVNGGANHLNKLVISDPKVKALVNDTDIVLPEFKADILLSLVESGKVTDVGLQKALINRAFTTADAVEPGYAEAPYGSVGTTPQGRKAIALSMTQLDRMSLQSRAVHDMQAVNSARARAMFGSMQFPVLDPLGCNENRIYAPGPFYSALTEVAEKDFSPEEVAKGKRLMFLTPYVSHLESHAQIIPIARFLKSAELAPEELRQLSSAFADALPAISRDEHTFSVIADDQGEYVTQVYGASLSDAVSDLVVTMQKAGVSPVSLLHSLRAYLIENFNGPRCNTQQKQSSAKKAVLPYAVTNFNYRFDSLLKQSGVTPIGADELTKAAVLPTRLWDQPADNSHDADRLTAALQKLERSLDQSTKQGQVADSWWRDLDDFLSSFYSWQQGDETEADYVRERADLYNALVDMIPKSPQRQKVFENYLNFLEQHSYQNLGGAEWFIYVKLYFMGMYGKDSHQEILNSFLNSRDPVLNLYARLEELNGKPIGAHWPAGR